MSLLIATFFLGSWRNQKNIVRAPITLPPDEIVVKKAIIKQPEPGSSYFTPYVSSYEDVIVKMGENFTIQGLECSDCSTVLDLKLKLIAIKDDAIVVETQAPPAQIATNEIRTGDRIDPTPGLMDVLNYFEFTITNKEGRLYLSYISGGISTMPPPQR